MTKERADTAHNLWCATVNNHCAFGGWGFIEIRDPAVALPDREDAAQQMCVGRPMTGAPS